MKKESTPPELLRSERKQKRALFDIPEYSEYWRDYWWDMPSFEMKDVSPSYTLSVHFMTYQDMLDFSELTGIPVGRKTDAAWFPYVKGIPKGKYFYDGPKIDSKYPICIPSKGRASIQKTGKCLDRMGVSYRFFVEDTEYEDYCRNIGEEKVVCLPFNNLGKGSVPARNFIWDWAEKNNYSRHWVVDDNIRSFSRTNMNRRLVVKGGGFFNAMEDFVDRYENIVLAGPHHKGFVLDRLPTTPVLFNTRIYSCILIDTSAPYRWRGRYNEDTDLALRILKDGHCTALFRALLMDKDSTFGSRHAKPLPGGNTDNVYNTGDFRLKFARSLKKQHPDVVRVVWKFDRWHHLVNYEPFKKNKPILKGSVVKTLRVNDYGMELCHRKEGV